MYTIREIAEAAGTSKTTVRRWLKKLAIQTVTIEKETGTQPERTPERRSGVNFENLSDKKAGTVLISDSDAALLIEKITGTQPERRLERNRNAYQYAPERTGTQKDEPERIQKSRISEQDELNLADDQSDHENVKKDDPERLTALLLAEKDERITDLKRQIEDLKERIERADQRNDEVEGRLSLVFSMLAEKDQQIRRLTALDMDAREETSETADEDDHLNDDQEINDHVTDLDPGQDHVARTTDSDPAAVNSPSYPADRARSRGIVGKFKNFFNLR